MAENRHMKQVLSYTLCSSISNKLLPQIIVNRENYKCVIRKLLVNGAGAYLGRSLHAPDSPEVQVSRSKQEIDQVIGRVAKLSNMKQRYLENKLRCGMAFKTGPVSTTRHVERVAGLSQKKGFQEIGRPLEQRG